MFEQEVFFTLKITCNATFGHLVFYYTRWGELTIAFFSSNFYSCKKIKIMVYSSLIKSHRWSWLDLHFGQRGEEHGPSLQIHGAQNIRLPVYNPCLSGWEGHCVHVRSLKSPKNIAFIFLLSYLSFYARKPCLIQFGASPSNWFLLKQF